MDYTLIHYDVNAWEGRAYEYGLETLRQQVGRLHIPSSKRVADLSCRVLCKPCHMLPLVKVLSHPTIHVRAQTRVGNLGLALCPTAGHPCGWSAL